MNTPYLIALGIFAVGVAVLLFGRRIGRCNNAVYRILLDHLHDNEEAWNKIGCVKVGDLYNAMLWRMVFCRDHMKPIRELFDNE